MHMRKSITRTIATSKFTLPVVIVASFLWWCLSYEDSMMQSANHAIGLWRHIPDWATSGWTSAGVGFAFSLLAVYLMAELNNKFVLLRISSRMLSSTLATLLATCTFIHCFQPGHIILVLTLLAYFPLLASYQRTDSMPMIFIAYLAMGTASLFFPKLLLATPSLWIAQVVLRSFTIRTLCASILGTVLPYWFLFGLAYITDNFESVSAQFLSDIRFTHPDYSAWKLHHWCSIALVALMGTAGAVNFYMQNYLDKTRTRIHINVSVIMFVTSLLLTLWETRHFAEFMPLAIINASILSGHHLAQCYDRVTNIYTIILLALIACVAYANLTGL